MPQLDFATPTGLVDWHYNISTPTLAYSPTIAPILPCVLFLHGEYCAQDIFESQFSDPRLREHFNLIGVDMRSFGCTKGSVTKEGYTTAVAADDVYRFIEAIHLPPVHIFALSIGCCVALELAIAHPESVRSLTLCSPLSQKEPEDVAAGRVEVYKYWERALQAQIPAETSDEVVPDQSILEDLIQGAQQLLFNNQTNRMIDAMTAYALSWIKDSWAGSPEKLNAAHTLNVEWFINRKPYSLESLAKINCPISLIHCADNVAYTIQHVQEFQSKLREAGRTDVFLYQVSGPHFAHVINPQAINPILRDFVLSAENHKSQAEPLPDDEFRQTMVTPFAEMFARYGYDPFANSDEEPDTE